MSEKRSIRATVDWTIPAAAGVLVALFVLGILAPYVASDPTRIEMRRIQDGQAMYPPYPPSLDHPFGTDSLGRDILGRVLHALRTSFVVGVVVRGLAMIAGIVLGMLSGLSSDIVDNAITRLIDVMLAFPAILLAMTVAAILGPGLLSVCVALVLVAWPDVARLVRGRVFEIRAQAFVEASRSLGAGPWHIITRHIVPNCLGVIVVAFSVGIPGAIMYEAGLSFFGYGIQPPTPSLGSIIGDGRGYITTAPWLSAFPGLVLMLIVLSFNLLGDRLVDALDPRAELSTRVRP